MHDMGGGGILSISAIELSPTICTSLGSSDCKINTDYNIITNHIDFSAANNIEISAKIGTFINFGSITTAESNNQAFTIKNTSGYIGHFINYGVIKLNKMSFWVEENSQGISAVTNYGEMGEIGYNSKTTPLILNNFGIIGEKTGASISVKNGAKVLIENYALRISEDMATFSTAKSGSSHLVIDNNSGQGSISFKDKNSKIILDFGSGFEFGAKYLIGKIATDKDGATYSALGVDFSRLMLKNDIYYLTQSGEYFIANFAPQYGIVGSLYKANVRTMNNFYTISNSMIYPRKYHKSQNLRKSSLRDLPTANRGNPLALSSLRADSQNLRGNPLIKESLDSTLSLKSYESFSYRNESQTRRIQRQNKRNYSRTKRNNNPVILRERSDRRISNNRDSSPLAQNDNYYFILTPFVNHNNFAKSGNYNLSGFDYGFLTAFSARVAESNSLGTHCMMSYDSLGDSSDKNFSIKNLNLNLGLNYKLDLIWDMYLKARGDFFYFLNQVKTLTMREAIKPNNLGFGLSVSYGKDFDFKQGGILGIEGGLDYKALQSNNVELHDNTYQKQLYNLLYADLGISYAKYFGGFGFNAGLGIKGNVTANKLAKSQIHLNNFNRSVDMILDNDKILGYANFGLSYVLNARNFDMEFSLAYYGNYGDRVISNGGGFEWRVGF